ncbi:MAG: hypothetical protein ACLFR1_00075 [Spirochaetia bacterium]
MRRLLPILFILILSGCTLFEDNIAVLWTDQPEIAAYIEIFNSIQNEYRIELMYKESPASALLEGDEEAPDIVISRWLANSQLLPEFLPLNNLFESEDAQLEENDFYRNLLSPCRYNEQLHLLPVSFNMPLIIERSEYSDSSSFFYTLEELQSNGQEFNRIADGRYHNLGFSPRWDSEFIYFTARLFGTNFRARSRGVNWNQENLINSLDQCRSWIESANSGTEMDIAFESRYLYDPIYKLVNTGRVRFGFYNLYDYYLLPEVKRDNLSFQWISRNDRIPVSDEVQYIGIHNSTNSRTAAMAFASWFFQPQNQILFLQTFQQKRMRAFGISGGFSSLVEINERELPNFYPSLVGKVPPEEFLLFPSRLPVNWAGIREEVVFPWLESNLDSQEINASALSNNIDEWFRQESN